MFNFGSLINVLGKPFYRTSDCCIFNVDCLNAMSLIKSPFTQLTFTSPPYNIGKEYETPTALEQYIEWSRRWLSEVYRITQLNGSLWLNLGYFPVPGKGKEVPIPYLLWDKTAFYFLQEIVWNYEAGVASKKVLSPRNEKLLWYVKTQDNYIFNLDNIRDKNVKYPNQKKNGKLRCNTIGKNPSNVWQIAKVTSGKNRRSKERTSHPAQTPIDLLERVVLAGSNKGDVVFDPFMGSGSTAITALKTGRKVVGFEIDKGYCEMIADRVETFML